METSRENDQKKTYTSNTLQLKTYSETFFLEKKTNHFFQPPAYYLNEQTPWLIALLLP